MNETAQNSMATDLAADAAAGTGLGGDAPAARAGQAPAGGDTPVAVAADKGKISRPAPRDRAESAMARVQARATNAAPAGAADGQAAGDGDSTGQAAAADAQAGQETPKAGAVGEQPAGSTLQAPQDWPREWTERFAALPTDEARQVVLEMNKDMTAGLHKGLQTLAQQRQGNESLFESMKQTGHAPDEVVALLGLSARFKDDPRGVLEELATSAGVPLASLQDDAPPEFTDAAALAKWASDKAKRELRRELTAERQQQTAAQQQQQARDKFNAELKEAGDRYADLKTHWPAVAERIVQNPLLTVSQAYQLARFGDVQSALGERDALKREVAGLKAADEARRKAATAPPGGQGGRGTQQSPPAGLTRAEQAFQRAERRLAANGAA